MGLSRCHCPFLKDIFFYFGDQGPCGRDEVFDATWLISSFLHYLGQMPSENSLSDLRCIAASVSLCVTSLGCYGYRCEVTRSPVELEIGEN